MEILEIKIGDKVKHKPNKLEDGTIIRINDFEEVKTITHEKHAFDELRNKECCIINGVYWYYEDIIDIIKSH